MSSYLMMALVQGSGDQLAMLECLRELGWKGSARVSSSQSGDRIEVEGEPLSTFIPAKGFLEYEDAVDMLHCLTPQLEKLSTRGKGMPSIEKEDVLVLGQGWYLLVGLQRAWDIAGDGGRSATLECKAPPLARANAAPGTLGGSHLAPELTGQISLPARCTLAASAYSIGSLLRSSLGLEDNLAPLAGSKLYYCIRRCLVEDPTKRHLIFI